MDEILEILNEIDDSIDYTKEKHLVDDHLLTSFGVISLVSELEDRYDITIEASDMVNENFNSAESILAMVKRLQEE
jgi:D-alanine--poly(phosphoribitol) ligase subunit 2